MKPLKIHIKAENLTAVVYGKYKMLINEKTIDKLTDDEKRIVEGFIVDWEEYFKTK